MTAARRMPLILGIALCVATSLAAWFAQEQQASSAHESRAVGEHEASAGEAPSAISPAAPHVARAEASATSPSEFAEPAADDLRIRVLDPRSGRATAALEVAVVWIPGADRSAGACSLLRAHPTGADPELRFPRARLERVPRSAAGRDRLRISLVGLWAEPIEELLPLTPWPPPPMAMQAPLAGSVRLRSTSTASFGCRLALASAAGDLSPIAVRIADGKSALLPCSLGQRLVLQGEDADGAPLVLRDDRGPMSAGEVREIEVVRAPNAVTLVLRVLRDPEQPLRRARLLVEQRAPSLSAASALTATRSIESDEGGWIRWSDRSAAEASVLELSTMDVELGRLSARVEIPRSLSPGEHRLGEVVLMPDPVLVAGIVRNAQGEPIRRAEVELCADANGQFAAITGTRFATCDEDGRFELRAQCALGWISLRASRDGYLSTVRHALPSGSRDVEIVLERPAQCRGSYLLPEDFPATAIVVELLRASPGSEGKEAPRIRAHLQGARSFAFPPLEPGTVTIEFSSAMTGVLARVEGIELRRSSASPDPRLQDVPLATSWQRLRLRLLSEDHLPIARTSVRLHADPSTRSVSSDEGGRVAAWFPPAAEQVAVQASGHPPIDVLIRPEEQELRLASPWTVVLPIEKRERGRDWPLRVALVRRDGSRSSSVELSAGEHALRLPGAGSYRLELDLGAPTSGPAFDYEVEITHDGQRLAPVPPSLRVRR